VDSVFEYIEQAIKVEDLRWYHRKIVQENGPAREIRIGDVRQGGMFEEAEPQRNEENMGLMGNILSFDSSEQEGGKNKYYF